MKSNSILEEHQNKVNCCKSYGSRIKKNENVAISGRALRSSYTIDVQHIDTTIPLLAEILKVLQVHTELLEETLRKRKHRKPQNEWDDTNYEF